MTEGTNDSSTRRVAALLKLKTEHDMSGFDFYDPPLRFISIETDEFGDGVELNQAETISEIVEILERSEVFAADTEIYDLDSGEVLRPDFERIYRIPRIYRSDKTLFWFTDWNPLIV
jgi:hypothetical protein